MLQLSHPAALTRAALQVSGDRSYRLWINGVLVLRGPDDPGSDVGLPPRWTHQWLYNRVDVGPYLHVGTNRISVEVVNADVLSSYSTGRTGFALGAHLQFADGHEEHIEGPAGWVGKATDAYRTGRLPDAPELEGLQFSASDAPEGWPLPTGTDTWPAATAIANGWGTLRPSLIPARMEAVWPAVAVDEVKGAVTREGKLDDVARNITVREDARFTLRFGRVISAYLALEAEGAEGTVVTLVPRESDTQEEIARPLSVRLRNGVTTWESPSYDSFSEVEVRIAHVTQPVRIHFVQATFTSQPVQYRGSFESSDDHLNALWKAARWQTQICLQDRFLDSPNHQEPIGDPGDYLIAAAQSDYAFGDPWMAAQNLRQFAALLDRNGEVTFHASYPLFWVQMLLQYHERTGDLDLVRELAPSVDRLLDHLGTYRGANGLLSEAPNYMFMDWIKVDGYNLHHPPAVIGQGYFSALYYRGLQDGARIARLLGDTTRADSYDRQAAKLRASFDAELWDAKAGLYRDGKPFQNHQPLSHYFPADRAIETHTDQVNLFAAL
ncbi:MAG: alpha-L-rhamnosidase-related protein, partial [Luteibacter jiangsuensis]